MKKRNLSLLVYIFIAIITLGVGYAAITSVELKINGTAHAEPGQDNFVVEFNDADGKTSITSNPESIATYDVDGDTTSASVTSTKTIGEFSLYGFTEKDQYADVTYTIINRSPDIKAKVCTDSIVVSGGSDATFTSTTTLTGAVADGTRTCVTLNANGGETTLIVRTTAHSTPVEDADAYSATDLLVKFEAEPIKNN